jgi:hypothetical protein
MAGLSGNWRRNPPVWIYALVDPRDISVRYVGRSRKPIARFLVHRSNAASPGNRRLHEWTRELAANDLRPMLLLIEKCPMLDAASSEQKWIDHFRARGPVFNATGDRTSLKPMNRFRSDENLGLR